jgi:hypothetical protein
MTDDRGSFKTTVGIAAEQISLFSVSLVAEKRGDSGSMSVEQEMFTKPGWIISDDIPVVT